MRRHGRLTPEGAAREARRRGARWLRVSAGLIGTAILGPPFAVVCFVAFRALRGGS